MTHNGIHEMSPEDYNKADGMRSSNLKHLLKSPAHYLEAIRNPFKATAAMQLGTAVHMAILEPDRFDNECVADEKVDLRTNVGKARAAEFAIANEGKTIITAQNMDAIGLIRDQIFNNIKVAELLDGGICEGSLFWNDHESNVDCKARPDFISRSRGYLVDVKTTQDATFSEFSKSIAKYYYHMQAAFYLDGMQATSGQPFENYFFVCIETVAPYGVKVYSLDFGSIDKGRSLYKQALSVYAKAKKYDKWSSYEETIESISIPGWAF